MKEDFLHYIWRTKKFDTLNLKSTQGESIQVINFGTWNHDAGPDFLNAKVKIDQTVLAGHVEIHIKASEWYQHKHDKDPKYDQTILHVVWEEDTFVYQNNRRIPCLELKKLVHNNVLKHYYSLGQLAEWIPCQHMIQKVSPLIIQSQIDKMTIDRLQSKTHRLKQHLTEVKGDWNVLFYENFAYYMGASKNKDAFLQLAKAVPLSLLRKVIDQEYLSEALLYGQAGFLQRDFTEEYPNLLKTHFSFLKKKFSVTPIKDQIWNFFRMRPVGFPTIRISLLTQFLKKSLNPFTSLLEINSLKEIEEMLSLQTDQYWNTHYHFGKLSTNTVKKMGAALKNTLIINSIIPILFFYGQERQKSIQKDKALHWLSQIKAENNSIVRQFKAHGIKCTSAFDTQGIIHLKNEYCDQSKCLQCSIGHSIMGKEK
jgi:hypothetical protein